MSRFRRASGLPGAPGAPGAPGVLLVAATAVAVEGLALLAFGGWLLAETAAATPDSEAVARGSSAYFVVLGLLVFGVAWALARRHGWAGGAGIFLQLLALPMAWYMLTAGLVVGGVPLGVLALSALGCLLAPATREALGR